MALRAGAASLRAVAGAGVSALSESLAGVPLPLAQGAASAFDAPSLAAAGSSAARAAPPRPVAVTVNVATPDAESFRRSEAQVAAALARAVARGGRAS